MIKTDIEIKDFEKVRIYFYDIFMQAKVETENIFVKGGGSFSKRTVANMFHDYIFKKIKDNPHENIKCVEIRGRKYVIYNSGNNNYSLTIKKINKNGKINNNKTKQTFDFINNNQIQGLLPDIDRLNFGYSDNGIICNFINPILTSYIGDFSFQIIPDNKEINNNNKYNNDLLNIQDRRFRINNNLYNKDLKEKKLSEVVL